ncbi:MAG: hypothetical protein NTW86_13495 [Candidatus Sumerlaeota bacterium]|nr:hypothetical protein [Candidatus Sumerlaeota bacterium]
MKRSLRRACIPAALACCALFGNPAWSEGAAEPSYEQALAALKKAAAFIQSISTNGGYVGILSLDGKERFGESTKQPATATQIWIQPPGTPTVGQAFLNAHRATNDSQFLDAARATGLALAWGQYECGGWEHLVDVGHMKPGAKPVKKSGHATYDDNNTQAALDFLMELDQTIDEPWLTEALELGLKGLKESQFPNGAWPQWFPPRGGYHDDYTFNDGAMNDCIRVALKAHKLYQREDCLEMARRGGDFIILSQLPPPQAAWAEQYSQDMKPAWARAFEPPGASGHVTGLNILTLVSLYRYTGDEKYLKPIPAAIDWLERSKIGDNLWARLYEIGTNRPIYGDRDKKVHYTLEEISEERQQHYAWQSAFKVPEALKAYQGALESMKSKEPETEQPVKPVKPSSLAPKTKLAIDALDEQGRWARDGMIYSKDFMKNANQISAYLAALKNK